MHFENLKVDNSRCQRQLINSPKKLNLISQSFIKVGNSKINFKFLFKLNTVFIQY